MDINIQILLPVAILLTGFVQLLKGLGLDKRFAWIAAVLLGTIVGLGLDPSIEGVLSGFATGLMATGFYDGTKQGVGRIKTLIK